MDVERFAPKGAVFVSYAREDAACARRIAEALRAAGLEVWFDENELRGGDTWDAKIRKQIRECTLFLPVISAQTQARHEGYFRREWKFAVERLGDMAGGIAFLVPVVVDDTREGDALVPEDFMRVQWTRLPGALPTPQFVEQVKRLLEPPKKATMEPGRPRPGGRGEGAATPVRPGASRLPLILGSVAVCALAAAIYFALRPTAEDAAIAATPSKPAAAAPAKPAASDAPAPATDAKSIAVLPFANMSAEKDAEFFADGVHEDLLTALAKVRDLKVISRTSVLAYRDASKRNLRQIAAELGVAHVLEGSVRRAGQKARITVQLIDARTDQHLWAESYDRDIADIFAVQGEVAREIAAALKATITPGEQRLIGRQMTADQQAYDLYVRARSLQQEIGERGTAADYERVIALFEQAIARDPGFVFAHVQVAQIHSVLYWFGTLDPTPARAAKMKAAVDAAVRLAPELPEVRMAKGAYLYRVELDWNAALAEFRAAEAGLPNDAQLKFWLAVTNRRLGRWRESLDFFAQSVAVNPRDFSPVENWLGFLMSVRRYSAALEALARFKTSVPTNVALIEDGATARFALGGDRQTYASELAALPPLPTEEARVSVALRIAVARGDLAGADRLLAATRVATVTEESNRVIDDPVAYHRAVLAAARGDRAAARSFATEAERHYRSLALTRRQAPWARMRLGVCAALAGRSDEAIREARAALADAQQQDAYAAVNLRDQLGATLLHAGRRDEAFEVLREALETPLGESAANYRIDPLWASVADDPKFEAILRREKAL